MLCARANAGKRIARCRGRSLAEISGENHSRIAKPMARRPGHVAFVARSVGNGGLRDSRRKFFRWSANVDRTCENRARHLVVDRDLFAKPLHFRLPRWNRCAAPHGCRGFFRGRCPWCIAPDRVRASRMDIFSIHRLDRVYWRVAHRFLGDRNYFRVAFDSSNEPVAQRFRAKSFQAVGIHFCHGLFANDDDAASNRWNIAAVSAGRKEILSRALVRNSERIESGKEVALPIYADLPATSCRPGLKRWWKSDRFQRNVRPVRAQGQLATS